MQCKRWKVFPGRRIYALLAACPLFTQESEFVFAKVTQIGSRLTRIGKTRFSCHKASSQPRSEPPPPAHSSQLGHCRPVFIPIYLQAGTSAWLLRNCFFESGNKSRSFAALGNGLYGQSALIFLHHFLILFRRGFAALAPENDHNPSPFSIGPDFDSKTRGGTGSKDEREVERIRSEHSRMNIFSERKNIKTKKNNKRDIG